MVVYLSKTMPTRTDMDRPQLEMDRPQLEMQPKIRFAKPPEDNHYEK